MTTLADKLHQIFFKGIDRYAIGRSNDADQSVYNPVSSEADVALVEQHLMGNIILGAYNLDSGSKVRWIAFDVDSSDIEKAREITLKLHEFLQNIPHIVEFSGGKGYHVIVILRNKIDADRAKNIGETIREYIGARRSGDPHVEVFPKQDRLTSSNPYGNLLKVPLGVHPVNGNRSVLVDPDRNWEEVKQSDIVFLLDRKTTLIDLGRALSSYEADDNRPDPQEEIMGILGPFWQPGQRHDLALHLAGYLATSGWKEEDTLNLIEKLQQNFGGDLTNQQACVTDTYRNIEDGKSISGIQGLTDILSEDALDHLIEVVADTTDVPTISSIDRIREQRLSQHIRVRKVGDVILKFLQSRGSILFDTNLNDIFWLNKKTHTLLPMNNEAWNIFLLNTFGINSLEPFGRQVINAIYGNSMKVSTPVETHSRSWWSGHELWINLGKDKNYVIDGRPEDMSRNGTPAHKWGRIVFNGEEDVVFRNDTTSLSIDLEEALNRGVKELNPWDYTINDLNFGIGATGISPIEQRELIKAWFLSTFFPNVMLTRPILTIIAPPGAGKTTAARRFLRILEGPNSEVIGLLSDKPDSLRTSIALHRYVVLDNLEKSRTHWLSDLLNRVSTGTHIELRKLYTTNETQIITPNCFIILTATSLPSSEESLFSRILPVELAPLLTPTPEYTMQQRVANNIEGIWLGILDILNAVVGELNRVTTVEAPSQSRLADFYIFCARIQGLTIKGQGKIDGDMLMRGFETISNRQKALLWDSSPMIQVLDMWIKADMAMSGGHQQETAVWKSATELNSALRSVATKNKVEWPWETGQALSLHIKALEAHLIRLFGLRIKPGDGKHSSNQYRIEKTMTDDDQPEFKVTLDRRRKDQHD